MLESYFLVILMVLAGVISHEIFKKKGYPRSTVQLFMGVFFGIMIGLWEENNEVFKEGFA